MERDRVVSEGPLTPSYISKDYGGLLLRTTGGSINHKITLKSPSEVLSTDRYLKTLLSPGISPTESFKGRTCAADLEEFGTIDEPCSSNAGAGHRE